MNYYFDESGNWSDRERNRLVLGGLLIKEKDIESKLYREFRILKAENNIDSLHATDLSTGIKEICYQIINSILTDDTAVLLRIFNPNISNSKTQKKSDEIYSELAADLINTISFGDRELNVFYDMKFHYAYPANVIQESKKLKPRYYEDMKRNFNLSDKVFLKTRDNLVSKIRNLINIKKVNGKQKMDLENFLEAIADKNCFDDKSISKLEQEKNRVKDKIADYLWSELWLHIEGKEQAQEIFRANIMRGFNAKNKNLGTSMSIPNLNLRFVAKQNENPGVQVIDFICNLVYRNGTKAPVKASNAVKSIFSKIDIEEIK